jgi:ankyrin repeat protein
MCVFRCSHSESLTNKLSVQTASRIGEHFAAPLISSIALSRHNDTAASIEQLLEAGAVVYATANGAAMEEYTALMVCSLANNLISVQALLQGGADPCYQTSSDGKSALHLAAAAGCISIYRALHAASSGRALRLVGESERVTATPLIAACIMEQYDSVDLLCALGADVNLSSVTGTTPLMAAVVDGQDTSILRFLLQQDGIEVNHRSNHGDTP